MELPFQHYKCFQAAQTNPNQDEDGEESYLRGLDAELFTLPLIDYIIVEIASPSTNIPSIRQRIMQILNLRSTSTDTIKSIVCGKKRDTSFFCQ